MSKYVISEITNVTLVMPKTELVQKNKPKSIQTTKEEYQSFLKENAKYIYESYNIASADTYVVKDKYGNVIASVYYYMEEMYSINPELLKLGMEKHKYIEDEFKKVGEERIELGNLKSCSMESQYKIK